MTARLKLVSDPLDTAIRQRDDARSIAACLWDENAGLIDTMQHARDWIGDEPCTCRVVGTPNVLAEPFENAVDPCSRCISLSILTLPTVMPL